MISSGGDLKVWGLLLVCTDDCLAVDAGVDAVGYGFDFGEFGHAFSSIGGWASVLRHAVLIGSWVSFRKGGRAQLVDATLA